MSQNRAPVDGEKSAGAGRMAAKWVRLARAMGGWQGWGCDSGRGGLGSFGAGEASGAGLAFGGAGAGGALGVLAIGLGLFVGLHKLSSRFKKNTRRLG
jgi:hypothetical protein